MIPAPTALAEFDSMPGEEIEFGIGDPRWVMRTQSRLYSDSKTAVIREYSTNAYDANIMAGNTAPIQVTLPSAMSPFFIVKDEGVGMDMEAFRKVYTQFGVSPKRGSNETNGMLGYGSKSALAYLETFQVTSVCDGIKTIGIIRRKPDWSIVLKVVHQDFTDEANGTEIRMQIPAADIAEFNHKANEFYKFWLPGRVLVNGREPKHEVGGKITDNFYFSTHWNQSYVVMGNVAYRINNPQALFRNTRMNSVNFVAYVDDFKTEDGAQAVEFTPSREDLEYTDRTKATLARVIADFESQILTNAKADIAKATTHVEAYAAWSKWSSTLGETLFDDLSFKGDKFSPTFPFQGMRYSVNRSYNATQSIRQWDVHNMDRTLVITEYDLVLSSNHKKQAREYLNLKGLRMSHVLFTNEADVDCKWISRENFVKWEDLKAALPPKPKAPRNYATGPRRLAGTFDYYTATGIECEKNVPDNVSELFYVTVKDSKWMPVRHWLQLLKSDGIVVILAENRINKFKRENPNVKEIYSHVRSKVVIDAETLLSDEAKQVLGIAHSTRVWANRLDPARVDDPEIARIRSLIEDEVSLLKRYRNNADLATSVRMGYDVRKYSPQSNDYLMEAYPLLRQLHTVSDDLYIYLNAVYAAKKENTDV